MKILGRDVSIKKTQDGNFGLYVNKLPQPENITTRQTFNYVGDIMNTVFSGDKFPGSFGMTKDYSWVDYHRKKKRPTFRRKCLCKRRNKATT